MNETRHRCPDCGYVRTADQDAPAFHKPGCKVRRRLQQEQRKDAKPEPVNLKTYKGAPQVIIGDTTAKLGKDGFIVAARSLDGLRWMAGA